MQLSILTPAEEHLMLQLWRLQDFYLKDVMEQLPEPKQHQNTVSTYLKILIEKNYLAAEKEGRIFKYSVLVPQDVYRKFVLKDLISKFYSNDGTGILQFLLDEKLVSQKDILNIFDFKIEIKPHETENPALFPIADEILNGRKDKKKKKKKK